MVTWNRYDQEAVKTIGNILQSREGMQYLGNPQFRAAGQTSRASTPLQLCSQTIEFRASLHHRIPLCKIKLIFFVPPAQRTG